MRRQPVPVEMCRTQCQAVATQPAHEPCTYCSSHAEEMLSPSAVPNSNNSCGRNMVQQFLWYCAGSDACQETPRLEGCAAVLCQADRSEATASHTAGEIAMVYTSFWRNVVATCASVMQLCNLSPAGSGHFGLQKDLLHCLSFSCRTPSIIPATPSLPGCLPCICCRTICLYLLAVL